MSNSLPLDKSSPGSILRDVVRAHNWKKINENEVTEQKEVGNHCSGSWSMVQIYMGLWGTANISSNAYLCLAVPSKPQCLCTYVLCRKKKNKSKQKNIQKILKIMSHGKGYKVDSNNSRIISTFCSESDGQLVEIVWQRNLFG